MPFLREVGTDHDEKKAPRLSMIGLLSSLAIASGRPSATRWWSIINVHVQPEVNVLLDDFHAEAFAEIFSPLILARGSSSAMRI